MNPYPIRMCGLGGLAGGTAIAVPDELRELSEKALPTLGELRTDRSFMDGDLTISCTGSSHMRATELSDSEAEFIVAAVNFVRSLVASSPPSDMVMVPREPTEEMVQAGEHALIRIRKRDALIAADIYRTMIDTAPTLVPNQKENP